MKSSRLRHPAWLLGLALLAAPVVASAQWWPKEVGAFTGLLPKDFVVKDVAEPAFPIRQPSATLAVIASTNLETLTKKWIDTYDRGGAQKFDQKLAAFGGALQGAGMTAQAEGLRQGLAISEQRNTIIRAAGDPRAITDAVITMMRPYFARVVAAPDFATALDEKADYLLLVDYHAEVYPPYVNSHYRSHLGLHLFNARLERILLGEGKYDTKLEGRGFMGLGASPSSVVGGMQKAYSEGIRIPSEQVATAVRAGLGPPPEATSSPMPTEPGVAPLIPRPIVPALQQCIDICRANTSRTGEQCFDACNKPAAP